MTEHIPLVSVIIPCYNYGRFLIDTIESAKNSHYPAIEIIVVDDGSDDPFTLRVMDKLSVDFPQITLIKQANQGLPAARNAGIRVSRGKYILPLDSDDLIDPYYITKSVWHLENDEKLAFIYPLVKLFGYESGVWVTEAFDADLLLHHNYIPASAVYRKRLWESLGGYEESMRSGYEDWEFWIRAVENGQKGYRLEEQLFYYRQHQSSMLKGSRLIHGALTQQIQRKHQQLYNFRWKMRILKFYGMKKGRGAVIKIVKKMKLNKIERLRSYASKVKHERSLSSIRLEQQSIRAKFLALPNVTFDYSTLYLLPWLDIGGVEQVFLHLLSNVNREIVGNRYLMTTIKHEHPWDEQFAKHCEGIFHLPLFCRGDAQMLQFICDFIENNQVRIIHISNSRLGYRSAAYLKERFPYLKIIDTLHMEEPYKPWDYFRVSRDFGKILDHRVVLTNYQKQRLINIYEEKESRVSVIANGIELFDKSWPESKKELAFIGRLVDQKRPVFFVQIADFLVKAKIRYPIVIIGSGPLENKLKKQLKKKGLQNKIVYKPAMSNIRGYLRESVHVLVAPSKMEGLPMTGLESMAEGTLVIASNVPGWTDLIDKNINGILLDNEEGAAQWAEQIMKALSDDAVIEELKYNARLKVEIEYSIGQMCFNYEQIYIRGGKNGKH